MPTVSSIADDDDAHEYFHDRPFANLHGSLRKSCSTSRAALPIRGRSLTMLQFQVRVYILKIWHSQHPV